MFIDLSWNMLESFFFVFFLKIDERKACIELLMLMEQMLANMQHSRQHLSHDWALFQRLHRTHPQRFRAENTVYLFTIVKPNFPDLAIFLFI